MRGSALRPQAQSARRLSAHDDRIVARFTQLAGFEAEAGIEALEALHVIEAAAAPLLIVDQQQRRHGQLGTIDERTKCSKRECHTALHVIGSSSKQVVAASPRRQEGIVRDDSVEVADQQDFALAGAINRDDNVRGVLGGRAGDPLDPRAGRGQRRDKRDHLLGCLGVTGRRRDRDHCLCVSLGHRRHLASMSRYPFPGHCHTLSPMATEAQVGEPAPDFELPGTGGNFRLSDHRGERVILLFYPGDNTPVCTKQFCSYRDDSEAIDALGATVVGISSQGLQSHQEFIASNSLTIPLLADVDKAVAKKYGLSAPVLGTRRAALIVDEDGIVRYRHVHALGLSFQNAEQLGEALAALPAR